MRRLVMLAVLFFPFLSFAETPPDGEIHARNANDLSLWSLESDVKASKADRFNRVIEIASQDRHGVRIHATLDRPTKQQVLKAMESAKNGLKLPAGAVDSLAEVNRQRAQRGLRPYIFDAGLTKAAADCAAYRAANRIAGHTNDFAFVPPGSSASCAGCAAWREGFGACEILGNWTYAGAAYVVGSDGLKYCHVFYR